jgi:excinuclease ABC subunit B
LFRRISLIIDESHMTIPQVQGMAAATPARRSWSSTVSPALGHRQPSAQFRRVQPDRPGDSPATPGPFELKRASQVVEQIIRPTGPSIRA